MLSVYALSGEPTLLRHAERIGQILLPAFNGTKSGVWTACLLRKRRNVRIGRSVQGAIGSYRFHSGGILLDGNKRTVLFAEAASCQLEFKYLAKITGHKDYRKGTSFS
jgi:mannosyl-oligosaccharide alpha-1,2-mannosidase